MPDNRRDLRDTPRSECYDKLRACMERNLREYYVAHPERLMDARSVDKIEMMKSTLTCMLVILDGYEISDTPKKGQ